MATDHEAIRQVCGEYQIPCKLTSPQCPPPAPNGCGRWPSPCRRTCMCAVNGDEPLIEPQVIDQVVPSSLEGFFAANLMAPIHSPWRRWTKPTSRWWQGRRQCPVFLPQSHPPPQSQRGLLLYKHLGVLCYTSEALEFFANTPRGPLEAVEDVNELRFIEHGKPLRMVPVEAESLSVDTPKDLEYVRGVLQKEAEQGGDLTWRWKCWSAPCGTGLYQQLGVWPPRIPSI